MTATRWQDDKTFIVGIGAQKAGTSWLFEYFGGRGDIYVSSIKELHFFDQRHRPDLCGTFNAQFENRLLQARKGTDRFGAAVSDLADRVRMTDGGLQAYVDFFKARVPRDVDAFSEITPAYSLLRADGFREIAETFPNHKIIFLMRDPIDRHYSAVKMYQQRLSPPGDARAVFLESLDDPRHVERGSYQATITSLLRAIPQGKCFFGFYETLFTDAELRRLCRFLDVDYRPGRFTERVNTGVEEGPLAPHEVEAAYHVYADTYAFCRGMFGPQIPGVWKH